MSKMGIIVIVLGWLAVALELLGNWLIGNKRRIGFAAKLLCCLFWIVVGISSGIWSLAAVGILAGAINIRNWYKWQPKPIMLYDAMTCSEWRR